MEAVSCCSSVLLLTIREILNDTGIKWIICISSTHTAHAVTVTFSILYDAGLVVLLLLHRDGLLLD